MTQERKTVNSIERLEQYLSVDEISHPRTAKEYIRWIDEKHEILRKRRLAFNKQNLLHQDIAKIFYEEVLPLYCLLKNKSDDWREEKFKPVIGNQNYDVEVQSERKDVPRYIEITTAEFNREEHNRMECFSNFGHVDLLRKVVSEGTKKTGKKSNVEEAGFVDEELVNQLAKDWIRGAINRKINIAVRPDHTALLVYFDDYIHFRYDDDKSKDKMDIFLI